MLLKYIFLKGITFEEYNARKCFSVCLTLLNFCMHTFLANFCHSFLFSAIVVQPSPPKHLPFANSVVPLSDDQPLLSSPEDNKSAGTSLEASGNSLPACPMKKLGKFDERTCTPAAHTAKSCTPMHKPLTPSERKQLYIEIDNMRRERDEAHAKIAQMEKLVLTKNLSSVAVEGTMQSA